MRYIRSTSQDGVSIVSLEFPYGTNMTRATFDVQAIMNVAQANLPSTGANLKPSWVLPIDPLNLPVLSLSLTGKGWDPVRLRELADNQITDRLKTVPDVQSVQVFGGEKRQLQVVVDRTKLAAYGLSITDVRTAIDRQNVTRPGGALTTGPSESIVRLPGAAMDAAQVAGYPLTSSGGRVVYLRDVAQVLDTYREQRSGFHYVHDGAITPSVEVSVIQAPAASSPRVVAAVNEQLGLIKRDYPGIDFQVAYDNSHFVGILMRNMGEELVIAILLTGVMVLLFLGEWRGALISLTTIPVSLGMAALLFFPFGLTLNSSTLIGMLLAIGRLVDDSIIDIHAVERHLRMGKDVRTAAVDGITEVRLAVMASTLMLCIALSPLLFSGGIVQEMFVGLVWPIIFGLLASMLVSFTLTSLMAARLLRSHADLAGERKRWLYQRILAPVQRGLDRMEARYQSVVAWSLRNRLLVVVLALGTIIVGFAFYQFIGSEMMPLADVGQAYGVLEAAPGA
ncbi:MAG: efflux RND transporter permease subunit, partial [Chloroflexi bacterium]|nr:efflux RND transporter permease subunit [Chloroflexota bacterium]